MTILLLLALLLLPSLADAQTDTFYNLYLDGSTPRRHYGYIRYDSGAKLNFYDADADSVLRFNEATGQLATSYDGIDSFLVNTLTGDLTIGRDGQDQDVTLTFLANTDDGVYTWMEDEGYLLASDDILFNSTERAYFRDTSTSVHSADADHIDVSAVTSVDLNLDTSSLALTDTTDQFLDFSLGSTYLRNQTGDFYFGDTVEQPNRTTIDNDLVFPFSAIAPDTLPGSGFWQNRNGLNVFAGEIDLTAVGGGPGSIFSIYPDGDGGILTPYVYLADSNVGGGIGAQFALGDGTGNFFFSVQPTGSWISAAGGEIKAGGLEVTGDSIFHNHLGVGAGYSAPGVGDPITVLTILDTFTAPATSQYAINAVSTINPTADVSAVNIGLNFVQQTAGAFDCNAALIGAKFFARHVGSGILNATLTGGAFVVGATAAAGNVLAMQASSFQADIADSYVSDITTLQLSYYGSPNLRLNSAGGGSITNYAAIAIGDLNQNAEAGIANIKGIEILAPSGSGYTDSYGIDSLWSSRMQDDVAWWFGTNQDIGLRNSNVNNQLDLVPLTANADVVLDVVGSGGLISNQNLEIQGTVKTTANNAWDLQGYTATVYVVDGFVSVVIDGTTYHLLADSNSL